MSGNFADKPFEQAMDATRDRSDDDLSELTDKAKERLGLITLQETPDGCSKCGGRFLPFIHCPAYMCDGCGAVAMELDLKRGEDEQHD